VLGSCKERSPDPLSRTGSVRPFYRILIACPYRRGVSEQEAGKRCRGGGDVGENLALPPSRSRSADGPGAAQTVVRFQAWRSRLELRTRAPFWQFPAALGGISGLGLLGPFGAPLLVLTLSLTFVRIQALAPRQAAGWTAAFALGFFGLHLGWLFTSLNNILGAPAGLLVVPVVLLLAASLTLTVWLTRLLAGRWTLLALPAAWLVFDWLRTLGSPTAHREAETAKAHRG